ncbi:MAG: PD40 domain-containing protein, partial [Ktedonobacteraceae bacterium]|nr:PD40 domain-containing protein [Ktedonobacteraceae bacterium]
MLAGIWLYGTKHTIDNTTTSSTPTQEPTPTETLSSTKISQEVASANLLYSARLYENGDLEIVSLPGQETVGRFSTGTVGNSLRTDLYWSPDNSNIAIANNYENYQVWDIKSGQQIINRDHTGDIFSLAWSPDGKRIATSGGDQLSIWSAYDGTVIYEQSMENYNLEIDNLAWSPDSAYLAFSDQRYYYDQDDKWTVRIWDVAGRKQVGRFSGSFTKQDTKTISQLSWSSDGAWMVVMDGERVWRFQPHKPGSLSEFTRVSKPGEIIDLAWSPNDTRLALYRKYHYPEAPIEIWDIARNKKLKQVQIPDSYESPVSIDTYLTWRKDGKALQLLDYDYTITELKVE